MSKPNFESNPEQEPAFNMMPHQPVSELTGSILASLAEEFALNGGMEQAPQGRAFQGYEDLSEDSTLYVVCYYTETGDEVPVGEKIVDIVVADRILTEASTRPAIRSLADITPDMRPKYLFTNYYVVNEGYDEREEARQRVEKSVLDCAYGDLLTLLADNHRPSNSAYALERDLGMRTVTEAEAGELAEQLAGLLERKTQGA